MKNAHSDKPQNRFVKENEFAPLSTKTPTVVAEGIVLASRIMPNA